MVIKHSVGLLEKQICSSELVYRNRVVNAKEVNKCKVYENAKTQ